MFESVLIPWTSQSPMLPSILAWLWKPKHWNLKPWPNGTPNSSLSLQLGESYVSFGHLLGLSWLEFWSSSKILAQIKPGFPPFGHLHQLKPASTVRCFFIVTMQLWSNITDCLPAIFLNTLGTDGSSTLSKCSCWWSCSVTPKLQALQWFSSSLLNKYLKPDTYKLICEAQKYYHYQTIL